MAIETIYISVQALTYCLPLYSMLGFEWKVGKFLLFYYFYLMCFIYLTLYGMMAVALTPNHHIAFIFVFFFFALWNLFTGFFIPQPVRGHRNLISKFFSSTYTNLNQLCFFAANSHLVEMVLLGISRGLDHVWPCGFSSWG